MAISLFLGKTESGKTFLANEISKKRKKVIIYDNAHCCNDGTIIEDFSQKNLSKILKEYVTKESFRLIFRTPFNVDEIIGAETVAKLVYFGFGQYYKRTNYNGERLLFIVDEANKVSSSKRGSAFGLAVEKGRHYHYDTFGISQSSTALPQYWKSNASEIFCFKTRPNEFLEQTYGREESKALNNIEKYSFFWAKDNGQAKHIDKNGKVLNEWEL